MIICLQAELGAARAAHPSAVILCRDSRALYIVGMDKPLPMSAWQVMRAVESPNVTIF